MLRRGRGLAAPRSAKIAVLIGGNSGVGVLVTTSHLDSQAYKEIREDGHPVIVLAGRDIIDILKKSGLDTTTALRRHLHDNYPPR